MELEFDEQELSRRLDNLPIWKQIAFMLSCCERMFPNYIMFFQETGWGNINLIRSALDLAWSSLEKRSIATDFDEIARGCDNAAPDTEDFDSLHVSAALNAAISTSLLIQAFSEFDHSRVVEVASYARDSVDLYVQEVENIDPDDPNLEIKILRHPLMQEELARQIEDMKLLERVDDDAVIAIPVLRTSWLGTKKGSSENMKR